MNKIKRGNPVTSTLPEQYINTSLTKEMFMNLSTSNTTLFNTYLSKDPYFKNIYPPKNSHTHTHIELPNTDHN